jgi:protein CpxP
MKRRMLLLGLCSALLLGTGFSAMAAPGAGRNSVEGPRFGKWAASHADFHRDHWGHLLQKLDLSEEQQKEVQKLTEANREQASTLHKQLVEVGRQMRRAMNPKTFDEKVLRKLAAEKAKIQTELMVNRARTHSKIYALLTPEQQELADFACKLQRLQGHGPRGHRERPNPMGPRGGERL